MSTRSTIVYGERIHIYHELLDNTIHLEFENMEILCDVKIMTRQAWEDLGFPLITQKIPEEPKPL